MSDNSDQLRFGEDGELEEGEEDEQATKNVGDCDLAIAVAYEELPTE